MLTQNAITPELSRWTQNINQVLTDLVHDLPSTPVLGPEFKSALFHPTWLVYHRMRSSLLKGVKSDSDVLHREAIDKMLHDDALLTLKVRNAKPQVKRTVYQARLLCNDMTSGLSFDVSLVDFSSGEVFISNRGKTSLYQKLRNLDNWCLTADAEDLVVRVLYFNRGLKKVAMSHIRRRASRNEMRNTWRTIVDTKNLGLKVFTVLCRKHLFTYVQGSRVTTVPKSSTSRRTINVEPWLNLLCQRIIGISIRNRLKQLGNDLTSGQQDHQRLISNRKLATIDLSAASNSNALTACEFMLHPSLFGRVTKVRSPFVLDTENDTYHPLNMVAAMGCGFTFEIMTVILLSVARTLDPSARVYGDDIIISNRHASHFCECIGALGYSINSSKTFIDSPFRESCGSFWHDQFGYVKSYEIPMANNVNETIAVINKLALLKDQCPLIDAAHRKALSLTPRCMRGPYLPSKEMDSLDGWVWDENCEYSMLDGISVSQRKKIEKVLTSQCLKWNYSSFKYWLGYKQVPDLASPFSPVLKKGNIEKISFYLASGRRVRDTVKNHLTCTSYILVSFDGINFLSFSDILLLTE